MAVYLTACFPFQSLCEGMRILGCVKEVNELELVVSLPNGLQGFVQVTEICDAYTQKLNEQVAQEEPLEVRGVKWSWLRA